MLVEVSTKDAIRRAVFDARWNCIRIDIPIRVLGTRHYLRLGEPHFLWFKLSWERAESLSMPPTRTQRNLDIHAARLTELVDSMQFRGFDPAFPIEANSAGELYEGAHRLAVAYALKIPSVWVETVAESAGLLTDDCEWYVERFSKYSRMIIGETRNEMLSYCGGQTP